MFMHICISERNEKGTRAHTHSAQNMQMIFTAHLWLVKILQNCIIQILEFPLRLRGLLMSKLWSEGWMGTVLCGTC